MQLIQASAHHLPMIPDASVQMICTSPPYWGLRKYAGGTGIEWPTVEYSPMPGLPPLRIQGCEDGCKHEWGTYMHPGQSGGTNSAKVQIKGQDNFQIVPPTEQAYCLRCGGWRGELGLEPTVEAYIGHLMLCLREWHRVLRTDGTCWVNLGSSYLNKQDQAIPWRFAMAAQAPWEEPHVIGSERDRAWLAALVDGEGCIGIGQRKTYSNGTGNRTNDCFHPYLTIKNTDIELLERCQEITRYGNVLIKNLPYTDERQVRSRRTSYQWRLDNDKAIAIIRDIYPYLIAKRRQAVIAHTLDLSNKNGRALRGNGALPEVEQEKRQLLKDLINLCNQRQPVDLPSWLVEPTRTVHPGWWLRSAITWCKSAPMPESVRDRPTKATEQIFLLAKSESYYYDAEAVRENASPATLDRDKYKRTGYAKETQDGIINHLNPNTGEFRDCSSGRNMRDWQIINPQPFPGSHFACVDEATECLTMRGWKRHNELLTGEMVASFDMVTERLRWRPLEMVAQYDVTDQPLVYAKATSLDMALTPNHRCIIQRRTLAGGYSTPAIKRADELKFSDAVPTTAAWDESGEPFDERWAELLGWYIAEGYESKKSLAVEIYQSLDVNATNVERLRELLFAVGAEWNEAIAMRNWRGRQTRQSAFRIIGYAAARLRELAPGKTLQPYVLAWSSKSLEALMRGLIGGDGHTRTDGRISFIQKAKHTADLVQAICIRLGRSAVLSQRQSDGIWNVFLTDHVRRSLRGTRGAGSDIHTAPYTGIVWCPKTPDGTWVARRNGRVFLTGNTFPERIPEIAILAGTSARGCCPRCGAGWVRVVERTGAQVSNPYDPERYEGLGKHKGIDRTPSAHSAGWRARIPEPTQVTTGWAASCTCDAGEPVPCTVLDPFSGSCTTGRVAMRLGRSYIGVDVSESYLTDITDQRLGDGVQMEMSL